MDVSLRIRERIRTTQVKAMNLIRKMKLDVGLGKNK